MPTGSPSNHARPARGQITWVGLLLLASIVSGVYLAWVWVPVYILEYEVKAVVRDFVNQSVKDPADEALKKAMCGKLRSLLQESQVGEDGKKIRVPVVNVAPEDVTWERDREAKTLRVAFDWSRTVEYPYLDRTQERIVSVDITGDISLPDWGPQR